MRRPPIRPWEVLDVVSWKDFAAAEPEFATAVAERFDAHRHKTMATIRADGSPRISGTEVAISAGTMWMGAMSGSRRVADLKRDDRLAIHSGSDEPDSWSGDAKIHGRGILVTDPQRKAALVGDLEQEPPGEFDVVEVDLGEVSMVSLSPDKEALIIRTWRPGGSPIKEVRR